MAGRRGTSLSAVNIEEVDDLDSCWHELLPLLKELIAYHEPLTGAALLPSWEEKMISRMAESDSLVLLARDSERPVAFLHARYVEDPSIFRERLGFIDNAFVCQDARRQGIASRLAERAEAWFRGRGATEIELNVIAANELGRSVWQALGYEVFSERRRKKLA